jgi:hypothetical protein
MAKLTWSLPFLFLQYPYRPRGWSQLLGRNLPCRVKHVLRREGTYIYQSQRWMHESGHRRTLAKGLSSYVVSLP